MIDVDESHYFVSGTSMAAGAGSEESRLVRSVTGFSRTAATKPRAAMRKMTPVASA
ncbi:hypothetical protein [Actinomadura vinacea]|uniref:hypothetical protein n=1 Tax=Actinomadura vinacea TaxID=115336 RepID=UPI0031CF9239